MPSNHTGVLTVWQVQVFGKDAETKKYIIPIAVDLVGKRIPSMEKQYQKCFHAKPAKSLLNSQQRNSLLIQSIETCLQRELEHRGIGKYNSSFFIDIIVVARG